MRSSWPIARADAQPYRALCSTTYAEDGDGWKLLAHQQTPLA